MGESPSELQKYLADRDALCPGCGYNLRGLAGDRCPECARRISISTLVDARLAAGITEDEELSRATRRGRPRPSLPRVQTAGSA